MAAVLQKFATQADPGVLDEARAIAAIEGKPLQAVIAEAAALFESLAMNHPFVDAKKRIAFFLCRCISPCECFQAPCQADGDP